MLTLSPILLLVHHKLERERLPMVQPNVGLETTTK
jgi:hypothetical protein